MGPDVDDFHGAAMVGGQWMVRSTVGPARRRAGSRRFCVSARWRIIAAMAALRLRDGAAFLACLVQS
jgi:hypothetical protein